MHRTAIASSLRLAAIGLAAIALTGFATAAMACAPANTITSAIVRISACLDGTDWVKQEPGEAQEFLFYSTDQNFGFTLIAEPASVPIEDYRRAILGNAASATGAGVDEVEVYNERTETIAGRPWRVLEYDVPTGGEVYRFENFYYVAPNFGATQFVFWSTAATATVSAYRAGAMMATVKF